MTSEQWKLVTDNLDIPPKVAHRLGNAEELKDAALDGLIEAAKNVDRCKINFRGWATGCARKKCISKLRYLTTRRMNFVDIECHTDDYTSGFEDMLAVLDESDKELMRMRFIDDLNCRKIAKQVGMHERAVQRRIKELISQVRRIHTRHERH